MPAGARMFLDASSSATPLTALFALSNIYEPRLVPKLSEFSR